MRKILFAALVVAVAVVAMASAVAQNRRVSDANVYGHIIDASTNEHIPYVTISVKGTTYGTVADATGHFMLKNLPEGEHTLVAESIGYKSAEQVVMLVSRRNVEVNFTLAENTLSMDEVVVSATRNETNKKSSATIVNVASTKLFENTASNHLDTLNHRHRQLLHAIHARQR